MMAARVGQQPLFENVRDLGPSELFAFLEKVVSLFPEEIRYRFRHVLEAVPPNGDNLHRVLEVVLNQWRDLRGEAKYSITLVGPAGTGRRTLLNAIRARQVDPSFSIFQVADLQGLDEFLGYHRRAEQSEEVQSADMVVLVLDASYQLTEETVAMFESFRSLGKHLLVVLNKFDLVEERRKTLRAARRLFGTQVLPLVARKPESIDTLLRSIVAADSRALYPLAVRFPEFRHQISLSAVTQASFAAGLASAIPIPVSDILPLTAIQTAMLLKIARVFGFEIGRSRARELLPLVVGGVFVRHGTKKLQQQFPDQERLIGTTVAAGWTFVVGRATIRYFESLEKLLAETGQTVPVAPGQMGEGI